MTGKAGTYALAENYLRLKPDASVDVLSVDETFRPGLMRGQLGNFNYEFLVSRFDFTVDWPTWEVYPNGDEIVFLLSGAAKLHLENPDGEASSLMINQPGDYIFLPRGNWHTVKISQPTSMLFITAGEGTENRPL